MAELLQFANYVTPWLDYLLGWLLYLRRDLAIFLLAIGTTTVMTLTRKRWTNQELLRRGRQDLVRLKALKREARRNGDRAAIQRMRKTEGFIKVIQLRADLTVLMIVIVPIALVATWAAERLDYFPVRVGDTVHLDAYFSLSSAGKLTHVVPVNGVEFRSSAIQQIAVDGRNHRDLATARWTFVPVDVVGNIQFQIRHQGETVVHEVVVGTRYYLPPRQNHSGPRVMATEVQLRRYLWLGFVPGIDALGLPSWMVGYLILSLALVPVMRRMFSTA